MKTELDFNFYGKWITVPVEFSYSEMLGEAIVDTATIGEQEILAQLPSDDKVFLRNLAQRHLDRMKEIHRINRDARIASDRESGLAEIRAEALRDDRVANNSGIR